MKQLANKIIEEIKIRFLLVRANLVYSFQIETAFRAGTLMALVGIIGFAASNLVLIDVIFSKVDTIAGYTKNEMFVFYAVGSFSFFFNRSFVVNNLSGLIKSINNGELDLVLSKPVPSFFYNQFKNLSVISFLKEGAPSVLLYFALIDFQALQLNLGNVIIGIIVMLLGQVGVQFIQFVFSVPAYWIGESSNILNLSYVFDYRLGRFIPFEGVPIKLKIPFMTVIPVLISTGLSTSVIVGKTNPLHALVFAICLVLTLLFVESKVWNFALRNYTSASS